MSEFKYKIPKDFGIKWTKALRSGNYNQGKGNLYDSFDNSYCCIGVAGSLCDVSNHDMIDRGLFSDGEFPVEFIGELSVPKELIGSAFANPLVKELINMNDGTNNCVKKDFNEIADWIEANCEFIL